MVGAEIGGSAGGGGGESMGGFATQAWVDNNYVSIEWFDQIFQVFDDTTKLDVNGELPVDQSKMNIKAMFGFWTDFYISALGNGGQVGASIYLSTLADVNVEGVQNGQVLTWNSATSKWIATTPQGGGADMNTVWNALAANTNEQINASHLSTALTGYATQTDLNGYLPLTGGTLTGALGVSGRLSGSGDDEGIVITPASNGYAGLILGGISGRRSVFYLDGTSAFWRYCSGEGSPYYDIKHPNESGTIALQSWVSNAYLPLTGGTLTGALQVNATIFGYNYTNSNNAAAFIFDKPGNNYTGIGANAVYDQIYFGACDQNGAWISNYAQKWYFNGSIQSSGSLQAESVKIEQTNEINSYSGMLHLNYRVNTGMSLCNGGGNVGIGTSNPSYRLHVDGVIYSTTGVYSAGYVTALSDEREKNIIEDFEIPLDYIAKAPIVSYEWKDKERRGDRQHIGSIAQYWLREMPELVPEVNDRYTMDYGRIALLSAITVARTVVNHEQRLRELERRLINN